MSDIIDSFRLDGKVALVTGATYGIGMAMAEALGEAGARIAFNARHADKVAEAEKHYRELGFDAHAMLPTSPTRPSSPSSSPRSRPILAPRPTFWSTTPASSSAPRCST